MTNYTASQGARRALSADDHKRGAVGAGCGVYWNKMVVSQHTRVQGDHRHINHSRSALYRPVKQNSCALAEKRRDARCH